MGYLAENYCFQSLTGATDAFYSAKEPSYTAGATSYLSYFEQQAGVWKIIRKSISSTGTVTNLTTSNAPQPSFPTCDEAEHFLDGMAIGWGIAAAVLLAYSVKFLWQSR